jgi:putative transposase
MTDICLSSGGELREFIGETDHVHLLVDYPPSLEIAMFVNRFTGVSSRRALLAIPNTGSRSACGESTSGHQFYLAASCAGAPLTIIKQYVKQQNAPTDQQAPTPLAAQTGSASSGVNGRASTGEGGEVHVGLIGDEREFGPFIRDARTEDVAVACVVAERGEVCLAQRPFPHDELLADPPVSR